MTKQSTACHWLLKALRLATLFSAMGTIVAAQMPLADVEVKLVREPRGGCVDPCSLPYTVTIRADGTVEYEGSGVVSGRRTRSIPPDEVIALVNEFLQARFFTALDTYTSCCQSLIRHRDTVALSGLAFSSDAPYAALTLKIGTRTKAVVLREKYPADLGALPELVDHIGGPAVWH